jgi:4-amino-4-deoxy-L-arabinose transferase-like glycosyltransferase
VTNAVADSRARATTTLWARRGETAQAQTPWLALLALMALAAALRAIGLDGGLWWDEIRTLVDSVRPPLAQVVTTFPSNNQHTLYSVLAHGSIALFGDTAWTLRLPAALFGVATIPALYFLAREFAGRTEALLACLLLTVSYHHVWFSQNARGYTMLAFAAVACTALLLRGLRSGSWSCYVGYGVAAALGAYTHLTMAFIVIGHALACVLPLGLPRFDRESWRRWRQPATAFALAALATLALYAPMLVDVRQFFAQPPSATPVATPGWAAAELVRGLRIGFGTAAGALAGALLLACGIVSYYRQSPFLLALFVLPGAIIVAGAIALARPIFPRFLFFLAGFAVLIVVRGALEIGAWIARRWRGGGASAGEANGAGILLVAAIAVISAVSLRDNYRFPKQDFAGAAAYVSSRRAEGDLVVTAGPATLPYRDYYGERWTAVTSRPELDVLRAQGRPVWVLYTLADYLAAGAPLLMKTLREECRIDAVFRGTVANGDVTVCVLPPTREPARVSPAQ